ncbi:MAG TPA: DUF4380 domain-containing protein [Armatimonadota bacterium]|nr:DUF4380 domain-containing protein [Armatimonadota bacterium]
MRFRLIAAGLLAAALAAAGSGKAAVTVETVEYHGWPGAYRLSNGSVELVLVPQIGRIMRYGYAGERNVLWENPAVAGKTVAPEAETKEWVNFGGDKLWPAPQGRWGWPPDPVLDRGTLEVEPLSDGLRVTGRASEKSGIRYVREIRLAPRGSEVTLRNTMVNSGAAPVEWSVWEVTQVDSPDEACIPLHKSARYPQGFSIFQTSPPVPETIRVKADRACLTRHPEKGGKIASDSPEGWTEAKVHGYRIRVSMQHEPGKEYPDEGRFLHLWSNPDPLPYMELEVLSPLQKLAPGKRYTFTTHWSLRKEL